MRKILMAFAGLALVGAVATGAKADGEIYLSAFGGPTFKHDVDGTVTRFFAGAVEDEVDYEADYDLGFVVGGALGLRFSPIDSRLGFRIEAKGAYRHNEGDELTFDTDTAPFDCAPDTVGPCDLLGDKTALSAMGNVWLDFTLGNSVSFFVGGGAGGVWVSLDDVGSTNSTIEPFSLLGFNDKDLVFAYQAGARIAVSLPIGAELTLGYRYFAMDDPEFEELEAYESFTGVDHVDSDYAAHSAMVRIRVPLN